MKQPILYKLDLSPPARAAMMVGHVLNLPLEYVDVNMQELGDADYVDKNPMRTVPTLEDRGFIISDSHAIATYLITKYGADKRSTLYPNDVHDRAIIDSRLHFDTGVLFGNPKPIVDAIMKKDLKELTQEHIDVFEKLYQMTESYLTKSKYLAGDHFTVADICAGATITSLNVIVPINGEKFPKLIEWIGNLYAESCFQEINAPAIEQFNVIFNSLMGGNSNADEEGVQALGR